MSQATPTESPMKTSPTEYVYQDVTATHFQITVNDRRLAGVEIVHSLCQLLRINHLLPLGHGCVMEDIGLEDV